MKIIQVIITPGTETSGPGLLGLGDDGVIYEDRGEWEPIIPAIHNTKPAGEDNEVRKLKAKLDAARSTLRGIHTWATFENGAGLDPERVAQACRRTLDNTNEEQP